MESKSKHLAPGLYFSLSLLLLEWKIKVKVHIWPLPFTFYFYFQSQNWKVKSKRLVVRGETFTFTCSLSLFTLKVKVESVSGHWQFTSTFPGFTFRVESGISGSNLQKVTLERKMKREMWKWTSDLQFKPFTFPLSLLKL